MSGIPHSINRGSNIRSALHAWKKSCELLSSTVQSFQTACATLNTACTANLNQPDDLAELENALIAIGSQLETLKLHEAMLHGERMLLSAMRNASGTLVRINTLPSEVLTRIFALLNTCYIKHGISYLPGLFCVCTRWRQLMINTPSLWSHVDIAPYIPNGHVRLFLERSKHCPIFVHTHGPFVDSDELDLGDKAATSQVLEPHIQRVYALDFELCRIRSLPWNVLEMWFEQGSPALSKLLAVSHPADCDPSMIEDLAGQSENAQKILQSLTVLQMNNYRFNWNSGVYSGLVDLRISSHEKTHITESQLYDVLSSNLALEVLKIENSYVDKVDGWGRPEPVVLNRLQVLLVVSLEYQSLSTMLSMMTLSAKCSVGMTAGGILSDEIAAFLSRSRITTLYLSCYDNTPLSSWTALLNTLPYLRDIVLYLWGRLRLPDLESQSATTRTYHRRSAVVRCYHVNLGMLKYLVSSLSIQSLRLDCCAVDEQTQGLEDIRHLLLESYPKIECIISKTDSTARSPCREMFNN